MATTPFAVRVLHAVRRIPPGRASTYGDVAALAGRPRAWRAVGNIMRDCQSPATPCHRVVAAGGRLGGYGGNPAMKRALLAVEGVTIAGGRIRDWLSVRWPGRHPAQGSGNHAAAKSVSPVKRRPRK